MLRERRITYTLEISGTDFSKESYMELVIALLIDRSALRVAMRGCTQAIAPYLHRHAYHLLSHKLPSSFIDEQIPMEPEDLSEEDKRAFAATLVQNWILRCEV